VADLLDEGVGCVLVIEEGEPTGLLTETDVLGAALDRGDTLDDIAIRPLCGGSVITTAPDRTIQHVTRRMMDESIKKLPVVEEFDVVGIVTLTDVVYHLSDIRSEAEALADRHYAWTREDD
jgi:CBS domain-containing protein